MTSSQLFGNAINELTFAEKPVSALFDWKDLTTAFNKSQEIFQCLCILDSDFNTFAEDLFNKETARSSLSMETKARKEQLDQRISHFLTLLCPHLSMPNIAVIIDWLIRRFFIHTENVDDYLRVLLPHHNEDFSIKFMQLLDWRFVNMQKWGWLKHYTDKGQPIPNAAFAKVCSKDISLLNGILWTSLNHVGQNEARLSPFVALYINTMINIFEMPLGQKKWSIILQPSLDLLDLGLKRRACPYYASAMRVLVLRICRTITLNGDLVLKWIKSLLKVGTHRLRQGSTDATDETVFLVKTLILSQNVTLPDKLAEKLKRLEGAVSEEGRTTLRRLEGQTEPASEDAMSINSEDRQTSLLNDLVGKSPENLKRSKDTIVQTLKNKKIKKRRTDKPLEAWKLQKIFVGNEHYRPEEVEAVLIRFLRNKELHEWSTAPKFMDLLSKLLQKHKDVMEGKRQRSTNSVSSDLPGKSNISIFEAVVSDTDEEDDNSFMIIQRNPLLSLINQVLLCIKALLNAQLASEHTQNFTPVDVEPVFQCLTAVKETAVHRLVLQVVTQLAKLLPSALVHDMMPVVSHMSHDVLPLDDEDSLNLISELVSVAIPAYLDACAQSQCDSTTQSDKKKSRKKKKVLKNGTYPAEAILSVLSCLVPTWSTIPAHRRQLFYRQLVHCINQAVGMTFTQRTLPSDNSLHKNVLWIVVLLFLHELVKTPMDQQEKLFNFLCSLLSSYDCRHQLDTLTAIYQFMSYCHEASIVSDTSTPTSPNSASNQDISSLWSGLRGIVASSHFTALVATLASVHEKVSFSAQWQEVWRQYELKREGTRSDDNVHNLMFMLSLRELIKHLMHIWQLTQAHPEEKKWRLTALRMHQLVTKLSEILPVNCYSTLLLDMISVDTPSTNNAALQKHWPLLQKKAFELLLTRLQSSSSDELELGDSRTVQVLLPCLRRLKDILITTSSSKNVEHGTLLRCHALLCMKELTKCLLYNKVNDSRSDPLLHSGLKDAKDLYAEIALQISHFISQKNKLTEPTANKQEEISLSQLLIAALLPHLHSQFISQVPQLMISCSSSVLRLWNLTSTEPAATAVHIYQEFIVNWSNDQWQQLLSTLVLLHALFTAHESVTTEVMEEWSRGKLHEALQIYFRIATSVQGLLPASNAKPDSDGSSNLKLKDGCANTAKQCLIKLRHIRDELASRECTPILLKLLTNADYCIARGTLSIVRRFCRNIGRQRSKEQSHLDTVWEADVCLLPLAQSCLDCCDLLQSHYEASNQSDDSENEDQEEGSSVNSQEDPLWKEIRGCLIAFLQMPAECENEDRLALLMRLLSHAKLKTLSNKKQKLRMKMLLDALAEFVPFISAEDGEELIGRAGLTSDLEM